MKQRDTLIPADLPQIVPDPTQKRCAAWCGRGCTQVEYDNAMRLGAALAKRLGKGWKPYIWENLGWHYSAVSKCGRLKVHGPGGRLGYSAFLGDKGFPGGRWVEHASTPHKAVELVLATAMTELRYITGLVRGLT